MANFDDVKTYIERNILHSDVFDKAQLSTQLKTLLNGFVLRQYDDVLIEIYTNTL